MEYKKTFHSVYSLTYHMVFVTKYRKPVISNEIGDFMKERAAYLCERFRGELISAETDMDHIHLLVSLPPSAAPSVVVRTLKTQLSVRGKVILQPQGKEFFTCRGKNFFTSCGKEFFT